jgi:hypothetical protein
MKKATRQLLKFLEKSNPKAATISVKPLYFAASVENHCFENVMRFLNDNEDWVLRSGWLVGDYFGENGTAVMPHYWVYSPSEKIDCEITPFKDAQRYAYVLDLEIASNIDEERKLSVPVSLKINSDGSLSASTGENRFVALTGIDYKTLYDLVD